jgi:hypothetical protein
VCLDSSHKTLGLTYLAGIWKEDLAKGLCWDVRDSERSVEEKKADGAAKHKTLFVSIKSLHIFADVDPVMLDRHIRFTGEMLGWVIPMTAVGPLAIFLLPPGLYSAVFALVFGGVIPDVVALGLLVSLMQGRRYLERESMFRKVNPGNGDGGSGSRCGRCRYVEVGYVGTLLKR